MQHWKEHSPIENMTVKTLKYVFLLLNPLLWLLFAFPTCYQNMIDMSNFAPFLYSFIAVS